MFPINFAQDFTYSILASEILGQRLSICPVKGFSSLSSSILIIRIASGTIPEPSPLCTELFSTWAFKSNLMWPLNEEVSHNL